MENFRLIIDKPATGDLNMALDEALLDSVLEGNSIPVVRFYRWKPACLSLGYLQRAAEGADPVKCFEYGVDLVRRLTGGKSVLHDDELTYSVVIPVTHPGIGHPGVLASYQAISGALLKGFAYCGIKASLAPVVRHPHPAHRVCFIRPSSYEVTVGGKKLVGSAQTRRQGVILQHGSIPLTFDLEKTFSVMGIRRKNTRLLELDFTKKATNLSAQMGKDIDFDSLIQCLVRGFEDHFDVELQSSRYTSVEKDNAERLRVEKYSTDEWNLKR